MQFLIRIILVWTLGIGVLQAEPYISRAHNYSMEFPVLVAPAAVSYNISTKWGTAEVIRQTFKTSNLILDVEIVRYPEGSKLVAKSLLQAELSFLAQKDERQLIKLEELQFERRQLFPGTSTGHKTPKGALLWTNNPETNQVEVAAVFVDGKLAHRLSVEPRGTKSYDDVKSEAESIMRSFRFTQPSFTQPSAPFSQGI